MNRRLNITIVILLLASLIWELQAQKGSKLEGLPLKDVDTVLESVKSDKGDTVEFKNFQSKLEEIIESIKEQRVDIGGIESIVQLILSNVVATIDSRYVPNIIFRVRDEKKGIGLNGALVLSRFDAIPLEAISDEYGQVIISHDSSTSGFMINSNLPVSIILEGYDDFNGNIEIDKDGFVNDVYLKEKSNPNLFLDRNSNVYEKIRVSNSNWALPNIFTDLENSICHIDTCEHVGRFYNWEEAVDVCDSLGNGWRLPTKKEWIDLGDNLGGIYVRGVKGIVGNLEKGYVNYQQSHLKERHFSGLIGKNNKHRDEDKRAYYWTGTKNRNNGLIWYFGIKKEEYLYLSSEKSETFMRVKCLYDGN